MSDVVLKDVTRDNWEACANLKLSTKQGGLIAPNLYSLAESRIEASFIPLAIYHEDELIGFTMYGIDPDDGQYWIYRLMIDEKHQGNGYGKAAMIEVIRRLRELPDCKEVYVGYKPQNMIAAAMFASLGFVRTGQMLQGEFIARLELDHADVVDTLGTPAQSSN